MIGKHDPLLSIAASVGGEIGFTFLEHVVSALRDAMSAELVLITLGEGQPPHRARAIFALKNGSPAEHIEYDLEGTPCALAYRGETVVVPANLADRFPKEEGFTGYVGVPLRDSDGQVSGHFAVFSANPILAPEVAESMVRIFGARIEADLRYRALLAERDDLIADLTRANETLRERSQALHDANHFKTSLLGMIAHDLRNPLAVIISRAELLEARLSRENFDIGDVKSDIGKILSGADRMTGMIESTLGRCREESRRIEVRKRPTDLKALARVAIETNRGEADRKRIHLKGPVDGESWGKVDEGLCLEAIDNLVSNAIKYSPSDTRVEITVDDLENRIRIAVDDQGQGLSEADLNRVFGPFQILSAKPTGGEKATGLGLANVWQIAEAHGGTVVAESNGVGLGARFVLTLPQ